MNFIWSFSFDWNIVDFRLVCFHWSDQRILILKLVPGFVSELFVGRIQTAHTYLPPPCRIWGGHGKDSSWVLILVQINWMFLLNSNILQLNPTIIPLLIVDLCFCIDWISVFDIKTCPRVCYKIVCGPCPKWTYRFHSLEGWTKVLVRVPVLWLYL